MIDGCRLVLHEQCETKFLAELICRFLEGLMWRILPKRYG